MNAININKFISAINIKKIINGINVGFINNDFAHFPTFPSAQLRTFVLPVSTVPSAVHLAVVSVFEQNSLSMSLEKIVIQSIINEYEPKEKRSC